MAYMAKSVRRKKQDRGGTKTCAADMMTDGVPASPAGSGSSFISRDGVNR